MTQSTRVKERQAAQAQRIKQAQAFMVPKDIDVAIIGGGAAGLCTAITAAETLGTDKRVVVFEKALEISGCSAHEVIHIGDSMASDVAGARAAGIRPILLDRKGAQETDGVMVVRSLDEALAFIVKELEQ